jgi:steroid 5-alpha reductase family enzyme
MYRILVNLIIILATIISYFVLFESKSISIAKILNINAEYNDMSIRVVFFLCLLSYQFRFLISINYLKRGKGLFQLIENLKLPLIFDAISCVSVFGVMPILLAVLNIKYNKLFDVYDILLFIVFVIGIIISTTSEHQRKLWKLKPNNRGLLYTKGLFKLSMHINYFGESLLVAAYFYIATGNFYILIIVFAAQLVDFMFIQIPVQDKYLENKYGDQFAEFKRKTKKLIPFVY